jgi:hypothetical protein
MFYRNTHFVNEHRRMPGATFCSSNRQITADEKTRKRRVVAPAFLVAADDFRGELCGFIGRVEEVKHICDGLQVVVYNRVGYPPGRDITNCCESPPTRYRRWYWQIGSAMVD